MDQYTTEEQQVEAIKKFWKENGMAIVVGAVVGLGGLWGWRYYNQAQFTAQEQASDGFQEIAQKIGQEESAFTEAKQFISENGDSHYAVLTALQLAKEAVNRDDLSEASNQLEWAAANVQSSAIKDITLIRLARVQLQQEQYADALQSLEQVQAASFSTQVNEVRGDVYQRQGMFAEAKTAYSEALESSEVNNSVLQMKLDDVTSQVQG